MPSDTFAAGIEAAVCDMPFANIPPIDWGDDDWNRVIAAIRRLSPTDTDTEKRCSTCGGTNDAIFCSNGFHAPMRADTPVDPGVEGVREALADFCRAAEYSAGCDEGVLPDAASSEIMSWAGSWMASAYDKAVHILAAKPTAGMDAGEVEDA